MPLDQDAKKHLSTLKFSLEANKSISGLQMVDWSSLKMVQPRSQGFFPKKVGRAGKGPGIGRSHDPLKHPEIVGVIN